MPWWEPFWRPHDFGPRRRWRPPSTTRTGRWSISSTARSPTRNRFGVLETPKRGAPQVLEARLGFHLFSLECPLHRLFELQEVWQLRGFGLCCGASWSGHGHLLGQKAEPQSQPGQGIPAGAGAPASGVPSPDMIPLINVELSAVLQGRCYRL